MRKSSLIFGGPRVSLCVSGLTADHYFWCSRVFLAVLRVFRGIMGCSGVLWNVPGVFLGCSRLFRAVPGCSGGVSGMFRGCFGVFQGVPGCSGAIPGFTDTRFQQPAMTLEINQQKYNLTQITCKLFNSKFLCSKQDFSLTRIKQSEDYEKALFAFIRGVCRDT